MRMSPYFHDLHHSYQAEIDDLLSDTDGNDVLQRRLRDKRKEFAAIVGLLDTEPLLLAPAFHGAFGFPAHRAGALDELIACEPGELPDWAALSSCVEPAQWARPLVDLALAQDGGEDFMALVVGLEYARGRFGGSAGTPAEAAEGEGGERRGDRDGDDGDYDAEDEDAESRAEDYLEQQGFDRRIEP